MSSSYFNDIQRNLLNPERLASQGSLEEMKAILGGKAVSGAVGTVLGCYAVYKLVSFVTKPVFSKLLLAASAGAGSLAAVDLFRVLCNLETIQSSVINRVFNSFSSEMFVRTLLKDTVLIRPFFEELLIRVLNSPKD